jgi:hypothetical protein
MRDGQIGGVMHGKSCPYEEAVSRARSARELPEFLTVHVSQCATCKELTDVAKWMTALAREQAHESNDLPDAEMVWRRAKFEQKLTIAAQDKVEWFQQAAEMVAPAILAMWVAENWGTLHAASAQFLLSAWPELAGVSYDIASLVPAALALCAVALTYPVFAVESE